MMKPRVAILGSGWGVRVQLPLFRAAGFDVVALGVRSEEKAEMLRKSLGELSPVISSDWRALITRSDVDLVSIVTPPFLHHDQALEALKAGKHVLCDKPFAMNVKEAEAMVAEARARPRQLALVDHELRVTDVLLKAREAIVEKGLVGKLLGFDMTGTMAKSFTTPWSWWDDKSLGGGALGAVGSHKIDTLRFLTDQKITKLSARLTTCVKTRKDGNADKEVTADYGFNINCVLESGVEGAVKITMVPFGKASYTYRFFGDKGMAVMDVEAGVNRLGVFDSNGRRIFEIAEPGAPKEVDDNFWTRGTAVLTKILADLFQGEAETLAERARKLPHLVQFEDGLYVQRVMDACHKSNDSGSVFVDV